MLNSIVYLQSLITLDAAYFLNEQGFILIPGTDKFGNKIVTITKEA